MNELKPCPFCGKKAYGEVVSSNSKVVIRVRCEECDTSKKIILSTVNTFDEVYAEIDKVKTTWNTRVRLKRDEV